MERMRFADIDPVAMNVLGVELLGGHLGHFLKINRKGTSQGSFNAINLDTLNPALIDDDKVCTIMGQLAVNWFDKQ